VARCERVDCGDLRRAIQSPGGPDPVPAGSCSSQGVEGRRRAVHPQQRSVSLASPFRSPRVPGSDRPRRWPYRPFSPQQVGITGRSDTLRRPEFVWRGSRVRSWPICAATHAPTVWSSESVLAAAFSTEVSSVDIGVSASVDCCVRSAHLHGVSTAIAVWTGDYQSVTLQQCDVSCRP
jgi:hypothetical protein